MHCALQFSQKKVHRWFAQSEIGGPEGLEEEIVMDNKEKLILQQL